MNVFSRQRREVRETTQGFLCRKWENHDANDRIEQIMFQRKGGVSF